MGRSGLLLFPPLLLVLAGVPGWTQMPKGAAGLKAIQQKDLKADLTFLTSAPLQGRMSLERGSDVAVQWIAAEFEKAGLEPVAPGGFLQPVPLIQFRADRTRSELQVTVKGKSTTHRYPEFFTLFPNDLHLEAPVVFAGYGITAPELNYDDYRGLDVMGKLVLVFDHEPQEADAHSIFNGTGNTRYATARVKALNAQRHGALAVLMVAEPNRKHPSNQERQARIAGAAQRAQRMPGQAIAGDELLTPVITISDAMAAVLLQTTGHTPSELQTRIDSTLQPQSAPLSGATVKVDAVNTDRTEGTSYNVVGLWKGSDPQRNRELIIYSGHYDHDGVSDKGIYAGADDNGSGTVGVVELARAFAANGERPARSILFIVFAAEERGLLGSYYYTQHPLLPLEQTKAVINFDMIGRNEAESEQTKGLIQIDPDTSNELNLIGLKYSPKYAAAVEQANRSVGLKLNRKWDDEAALNVYFRSDQFPFVLHDIPAMWWFTGFHPDYHQVTDTVDRINFPKMEKILKLAYLTGWEFSEGKEAPLFIANPSARH